MPAKTKPDKPVPRHHNDACLDWHECEEYLEALTGRELRDWAKWSKWLNSKKKDKGEQPPYQDFWHEIIDRCDARNDSYFHIHRTEFCDGGEPWIQDIVDLIFEHFGEHADDNSIQFYVWW